MGDERGSETGLGAYRVLAEVLPHLVWIARFDGTVVFYNRRAERYGGLEPGPAGVYEWAPIVHPDDLERTRAEWARAVDQRSPYECEHRVRMADGSYRWHLSRALPVETEGSILWFGTATDTHMLAETREALAESDGRLRSVFDGIDQGYCVCELVVDEDGRAVDYRFLETNKQFEEATGLRDATGQTALELVPGLERHWIDTYAEVVRSAAPLRFQQASAAMGRHFDVFAMPVAPHGRFALVFADITERQAALDALQESERRFRNMADHAPVMIWITDADGSCTYLNQRWFEFTGQEEEQALGQGWLTATHPEDRDRVASAFDAAIKGKQAFSIDYRLRRHDGSYRWAVDAAAPRFSRGGSFLGYVGSVLDISERKEAEDAVAAQRDREHDVAVRLQRSMLPSAAIDDARIDVAAIYRAGTEMLEAGGDWYETFHTRDGRVGVVVGDVVGHHVEAAAAMGQLRAGLLAMSPHFDSPDELLCELDRFAQRHKVTDFATALCIFLDPDDGSIVYSSAGHPHAMICTPNGNVRRLDQATSRPLGMFDIDQRPTATETLEPGAVLVAYSDGLIERRGEQIDTGFERLEETLRANRNTSVRDLCEITVAELAGAGRLEDDTVIAAIRRTPASPAGVPG